MRGGRQFVSFGVKPFRLMAKLGVEDISQAVPDQAHREDERSNAKSWNGALPVVDSQEAPAVGDHLAQTW